MSAVITKHLEQALADKEDVALRGRPFQVLFTADQDQNVLVTVRWPTDNNIKHNGVTMATMLHKIFGREWVTPTIAAIGNFGEANKQASTVQYIMQQWREQSSADTNGMQNVCVRPLEVFNRQK